MPVAYIQFHCHLMSRMNVPDWGEAPPSSDSGTPATQISGSITLSKWLPRLPEESKEHEGPGVGGFYGAGQQVRHTPFPSMFHCLERSLVATCNFREECKLV